jgi:SAM-dependent methyltransferase
MVKRLNVGSGTDYRKDWTNMDYNNLYNPEVVHNMESIPWPFQESTFDEILIQHVLEHSHNPLLLVNEMFRISKPGAIITIKVPHWSTHWAFGDLTHFSHFSSRCFSHFNDDKIYYNKEARFKTSVRLNCINAKGRLPARIINWFVNPLINWNLSLTENFLCKFIPIYENVFTLEVIK